MISKGKGVEASAPLGAERAEIDDQSVCTVVDDNPRRRRGAPLGSQADPLEGEPEDEGLNKGLNKSLIKYHDNCQGGCCNCKRCVKCRDGGLEAHPRRCPQVARKSSI